MPCFFVLRGESCQTCEFVTDVTGDVGDEKLRQGESAVRPPDEVLIGDVVPPICKSNIKFLMVPADEVEASLVLSESMAADRLQQRLGHRLQLMLQYLEPKWLRMSDLVVLALFRHVCPHSPGTTYPPPPC